VCAVQFIPEPQRGGIPEPQRGEILKPRAKPWGKDGHRTESPERAKFVHRGNAPVAAFNHLRSGGIGMPQSLSNVLVHYVFSTKDHVRLIDSNIEAQLWAYLHTVFKELKCPTIQVGGWENHVHILSSLSRNIAICDLMEEVKIRSSKWIKTKGVRYKKFAWQNGYGAFSIGQSGVDQLVNYIRNQKDHHRTVTFKEEYRRFLEKYQIPYDERYVWD
jgi:REP element-mobilizing transposase RayT